VQTLSVVDIKGSVLSGARGVRMCADVHTQGSHKGSHKGSHSRRRLQMEMARLAHPTVIPQNSLR
jgi:hypothetical protein